MKQYLFYQFAATMFIIAVVFMSMDSQSFFIFAATKVIAAVFVMGGMCAVSKGKQYGDLVLSE